MLCRPQWVDGETLASSNGRTIGVSLVGPVLRNLSVSPPTVAQMKAQGIGCAEVLETAREKQILPMTFARHSSLS